MREQGFDLPPHPRPRMRLGRVHKVWRYAQALVTLMRDMVADDVARIWMHARLFIGQLLLIVGLFSFASDKYCDGNSSAYYACTRPSTFYYYPWWAIVLIVLGSFSCMLWFLRKKGR
jgi:hypothetical protein